MRKQRLWIGLLSLLSVTLVLGACASADVVAVNKEADSFYGLGTANTEQAAWGVAFDDLVYNVLTETGSIKNEKKSKVVITPEMKAAFKPLDLKPIVSEKKEDSKKQVFYNVIYKLNRKDWAKTESVRLDALAKDLSARFIAITGDNKKKLGERLSELGQIQISIDKAGVPLALHVSDAASPLLAQAIADWSQAQTNGLSFKVNPDSGLVKAGLSFKLLVLSKAGQPVAGIPVALVWNTDAGDSPAVFVTTEANGSATFTFPADDKYRNKKIILKVATNFAGKASEAEFLVAIDATHHTELAYRNAEDLAKSKANEVKVVGGTLTVGAVKQDRRASGNEKARKVTVPDFYIDRYLVTNAQYISYLEATNVPKSKWPDYLDNPEYNAPNQPIIGITLEQANAYAAWISGVLGQKKRLPTEDEYEIAARAGQLVTFPWGDQLPTEGVRANYSGNKKFSVTSPVGSFENGKNALGIYDLVGNVWEWTSTNPDANMSDDPAFKIVKGGSWMDGANELRISNRRAVNPAEGTSDIGFRLVREALNE